ncbi:hypothetical protein [Spiroplasma endosymbiont of Polydrusus pterygomalis]
MKENNIQAEYVKRMRRKILIKQNRNKKCQIVKLSATKLFF